MLIPRDKVVEVNRTHPVAGVRPTDFVCEPDGEVGFEQLIADPRFSLYCFDSASNEAVFVELSDPAAADAAPFYYQTQAEQARAVLRVPLETFHEAADRIAKAPERMILIHSVGRCGSTLVSKVFASQPSVYSLSEPDDLTQLVQLHVGDGIELDWIRANLSSAIKWRWKPRTGAPAQHLAIKTRSEVLVLADLIADCFPSSKHLFVYRDAIDWSKSVYQAWPADRDVYDPETCRKIQQSWSNTLPIVGDYLRQGVALNAMETRVQAWITCTEAYLSLREHGLAAFGLRYEDLNAHPADVLPEMLERCGVGHIDWEAVETVLSQDSQAGTVFDRAERKKNVRNLSDQMVVDVKRCIAARPKLLAPDVILPGTILPAPLITER